MKLAAIITLIMVLGTGAWAVSANDSRVVIIVAGSTSIRDMANSSLPHITELINSGSSALVNTRTGRPNKEIEFTLKPGMEPGCTSIGAGAMAVGGGEVRRACDAGEMVNGTPARSLYSCWTGTDPRACEVLHPEIAKMQRTNKSASYRARLGALGSTLHSAGIKTAVIGNSDIPGQMHREAASIAIDANGLVDYGNVGSNNLIMNDVSAPCGVRTNQSALIKEFDRVLPASRLVVVDFGDTFRADDSSDLCTDEQATRIRQSAAIRLDEFIPKITSRLDFSKDMLILVSPDSRTFSDIEEERLTPIVIKGPGYEQGMLISSSTRRQGLIAIVDIAPTVLQFMKLKPPVDMVGRPVVNVPHSDTARALINLNLDASRQGQRQVAMRGFSVVQSLVVILVTVLILLVGIVRIRRIAAWLVLIPIALPLAMLYLPVFYSGGLVGAVLLLVVITAAIVGACALILRESSRAMVWLCGITVLSVAIDMLRHAALTSESITGYSMVEGARYYGIGNELMGTALGAAIIGIGMAFSFGKISPKIRGWIAAIVFAATCLFIGAPNLGANVGGALAAVPAVIVALLLRRGCKINIRNIALIAIATLLIIGGMFAFDAMRGGASQSHAGRIVGLLTSGDSQGVLSVFQRKIALNFMLLSSSLWSRLLGLSLLGSAILAWWGKRINGSNYLNQEESAAAVACMVGVIGAFAFNDSGVVAAATCAVFLWAMFALKSLSAKNAKKKLGDDC